MHMDAAYRLALWILRSDTDAEDTVQEAYLRAFKGYDRFIGEDIRPWLLTIVRNTAYQRIADRRRSANVISLDDAFSKIAGEAIEIDVASDAPDAEALLISKASKCLVDRALSRLPEAYREILVLRELEGFSYREIADIIGVPLGTVMSRLSRAREELRKELVRLLPEGVTNDL